MTIERLSVWLSHRRCLGAVLGILMAYPALLVVIASRLGPGLSPDSVAYLSAARSLTQSGRLIAYDGQPLTVFPPGLAAILSTAERFGLDPQVAAVTLNVFCVAAGVLLSYLLAARALTSRGLAVIVAAVVSVSWSTVSIYSMLWTEPIFTTLTLIVLLALARVLQHGTISWWETLMIGMSVSVATTIRFVGFTLLPVVALGVLFAVRARGLGRAAGIAAFTTGLSSFGLIYVAGRNIGMGVAALGDRPPSETPLIQVLKDTAITLGHYAYPTRIPSPWVTAIIGVTLAAILAYGFVRALTLKASVVILLAGFTAVYWLFLWSSQFATTIDPIDPRLTVPVFTPMLIMLAFAVRVLGPSAADLVSRVFIKRGPRVVHGAAIGLLVVTMALNAATSVHFAKTAATDGTGYNRQATLKSPLALALRDLPEEGIAASDPLLAYWTSGREPIVPIPCQDHYYWPPEKTAAGLDALKEAVDSGDITFLAFFTGNENALTPNALERSGIPLTLVSSYEDGSLYEVTRRE